MNTFRYALLMMLLTTPAFGQAVLHEHPAASAPTADATAAFDTLKTLAGSWAGRIATTPDVPGVSGQFVQFSLQVTSRGTALLHEFSVSGLPDHPVTLFYLDGGLTLTHYCDAGNRPRMAGTLSPDGKTLTFEFVGISGNADVGHMDRAVITLIDENHHTEEWTFKTPGGELVRARFELQRTNFQRPPAR
ncbi:MAG: hypothetical protein AB7P99_21395 [Vicinamibacterales bacterium]